MEHLNNFLGIYIALYLIIGIVIAGFRVYFDIKQDKKAEFDDHIITMFLYTVFWSVIYSCIIVWRFICVPVGKVLGFMGRHSIDFICCILAGLAD